MPLYLFLLTLSFIAGAHQSSLNSAGLELSWPDPIVGVTVQTTNNDSLSASQVSTIIKNSIDQWNSASRAKVITVPGSKNEIRFQSNWNYGSAVIGLTEVTYNSLGKIQSASIFLNDQHRFVSAEGFGQGYFLGDVITHELGHFLGLSHSEVLNSSMFFKSFPGQSSLAEDDRSGIRKKYEAVTGTVKGYVKGGKGVGVLGVHVQAISRKTGEAIGTFSDETGFFSIGGLALSDSYYLYTSPMKNPDSLPAYFSNAQASFCPGKYVGSFFTACGRENDGKPQAITLTSTAPVIDVGTVTIDCGLKTDLDYDYEKVQSSFERLTIFDYGSERKNEKAFAGWFQRSSSYSWSEHDRLRVDLQDYPLTTSRFLKITLVSYPFGTPLEYEMDVSIANFLVAQAKMERVPLSGVWDTDLEVIVPLSFGTNVFDLDIRARRLDSADLSETFPAYLQFTNEAHLPYLVMISILEASPSGERLVLDDQAKLSDNAACLDAPFTYPVKKTAELKEGNASTDEMTPVASCGFVDPPSGGGPGGSLPLVTAGFMLVLLASYFIKPRKKFLS